MLASPVMMRLFLNAVCKQMLKYERTNRIILKNMDLQNLRRYFGKGFLSPIQQFALEGYTEEFLNDLPLGEKSIVGILGGYLGDSAQIFIANFDCNLEIYEPIPNYVDELLNRFASNPKVIIYPYAVSDSSTPITLNISGETSSSFGLAENPIQVNCIDAVNIFNNSITHFDCLEINIEGGEYDVIRRLISTTKIGLCKVVLIQFHNFGLDQELDRAQIRVELNKTHEIIKDYSWIWERWDLRG